MTAEWHTDAACVGSDPELFFLPETTRYALRICADCPVKTACLDDAIRTEHAADSGRYGIRGGLTAQQRGEIGGRRRVEGAA